MGGPDPGRRSRALGTRDRVLSYLVDGEISDPKGMASTVLAEAVGYPGSSAAFAQLLSGMERSGLIDREIRGKRTYRIAVTTAGRGSGDTPAPSRRGGADASGSGRGGGDAPGSNRRGADASGSGRGGGGAPGPNRRGADASGSSRGGADAPGSGRGGADASGSGRSGRDTSMSHRRPGPRGTDSGVTVAARRGDQRAPADDGGRSSDLAAAGQPPDFDYDELARRLLVQVVRRLAVAPGEAPGAGHDAGGPEESPGPDTALQQTVAGLEQKLASVRSRQRRLTAENAKLREQLRAAQQSLAQAEERAGAAQVAGQLGGPELQLLERLLSATRDQPGRQEEAGAG